MTAILPLLMLVILFACVAMCYAEGMWSNAVRLINTVTAALLATSLYEPLARWLEGMMPSYTYLWDFISLWVLFGAFNIVFRELTSALSKVKVRFLKIADRIGSGVFAFLVGCVLVSFTMMTLHAAPLGKTFLFGGFQPDQRMLGGTAPDRQWLGFMERISTGAYARTDVRRFTSTNEFIQKYAARREQLEKNVKEHDSLLTN